MSQQLRLVSHHLCPYVQRAAIESAGVHDGGAEFLCVPDCKTSPACALDFSGVADLASGFGIKRCAR